MAQMYQIMTDARAEAAKAPEDVAVYREEAAKYRKMMQSIQNI